MWLCVICFYSYFFADRSATWCNLLFKLSSTCRPSCQAAVVIADLFAIVRCRLELQWRQSSSHLWHKGLELHCPGRRENPYILMSLIIAEGVKSGLTLWFTHSAKPLEGSTSTVLWIFFTSSNPTRDLAFGGNCHPAVFKRRGKDMATFISTYMQYLQYFQYRHQTH